MEKSELIGVKISYKVTGTSYSKSIVEDFIVEEGTGEIIERYVQPYTNGTCTHRYLVMKDDGSVVSIYPGDIVKILNLECKRI